MTKFIHTHRKALALLAALATVLGVLGGTWAWYDNSQHRTNIATGGGDTLLRDVALVEEYEQPEDWKAGDTLTKKVWAKNNGDGAVYVRVQLKEYMDTAQVDYTYTPEYLMVHSDGSFVAADSAAALKSWLAANYPRLPVADAQIVEYQAHNDTLPRFYFATDVTSINNGVYGKKMVLGFTASASNTSLVPGVSRASYNPVREEHAAGECLYTPHLWGTAVDPFHQYVAWTLGAQVIKLSAWDGMPTAKWVLDDSGAEGWAYWGQALAAGGSTLMLMESIELIQAPEGQFYYAIHVDMDAADQFDVAGRFTGAPAKILAAYGVAQATA